jgi:moderate conductance mechanosensitive channel
MSLSFLNLETLLHIGIILLLFVVIFSLINLASRRGEKLLERRVENLDRQNRLKTLLHLGRSIARVILVLVLGLMLLYELDLNVAPILASAGVAGLALSLGAQTILKDFYAGVVLLLENQYAVGDTIQVGDLTGSVERISLRATYLRNLDGHRIAIPNGDIRTVANLSAEWARAVVTLNVPVLADMEQVLLALRQAAENAAKDERIAAHLLAPPESQGWVDLTETAVRVRLMAKTRPGKQWEVAQVLRQHARQSLYDLPGGKVEASDDLP